MHHRIRSSVLSFLLVASSLFPLANSAFAAVQGSVKIDQVSAKGVGVWTLLYEDGSSRTSADAGVDKNSYTFGLTDFGRTTLSVVPPAGMSVKISVYRSNELMEIVELPQYSFTLYPNDNYRFLIQYALTRLGDIGVTSSPSGMRFRMKGPGGKTFGGTTPHTFTNIPAGRYVITMSTKAGCKQPAPQTVAVEPGKRNTAFITINCEKEEEVKTYDTSRPTKRSLYEYVQQRELKSRGERK